MRISLILMQPTCVHPSDMMSPVRYPSSRQSLTAFSIFAAASAFLSKALVQEMNRKGKEIEKDNDEIAQ